MQSRSQLQSFRERNLVRVVRTVRKLTKSSCLRQGEQKQLWKVTSGLPGWFFFVQCPGPIFLAACWSGPAASASVFSVCLDYILRVCQSLWDSFLYLGKLHWFLYLLLSYFYDPGMFIFRWSSNFVEKVVLNESMSAKMAPRVSYLVYYYCR